MISLFIQDILELSWCQNDCHVAGLSLLMSMDIPNIRRNKLVTFARAPDSFVNLCPDIEVVPSDLADLLPAERWRRQRLYVVMRQVGQVERVRDVRHGGQGAVSQANHAPAGGRFVKDHVDLVVIVDG